MPPPPPTLFLQTDGQLPVLNASVNAGIRTSGRDYGGAVKVQGQGSQPTKFVVMTSGVAG